MLEALHTKLSLNEKFMLWAMAILLPSKMAVDIFNPNPVFAIACFIVFYAFGSMFVDPNKHGWLTRVVGSMLIGAMLFAAVAAVAYYLTPNYIKWWIFFVGLVIMVKFEPRVAKRIYINPLTREMFIDGQLIEEKVSKSDNK